MASSGEKVLEEEDHAGSGAGALVFERRWLSSWALAAQQNTAAGAAAQGSQPGIRPLPSSVLGAGWSHNHIGHITPSGAALAAAPLITVQLPDGNSRTFSKDAAGKWAAAGHPELQLTLAADGAATLTDTRANTRLDFDAAGRITAATARNGWQTTYTYNQAGQLTHIRNAFGRDLTLTYTAADARGLLASVITPDGAIRYEYDSAPAVAAGNTASPANETHSAPSSATSLQRLKAVIYPDGSRKTYLYEDPARPYLLTGTIDQNGTRQATYAYDSLGRATSTQWAAGADRYSVRYNGNNPPGTNQGTVSVTDPLGASRSYSYQYNNGQTAVGSSNLAPAGNADPIRSRVQDAQGNVTSETSFTGSRTDYRWNARRLLEQITRAAGRPEQQSTVYEWHPRFSLPTRITDGKTLTTLSYDDKGNLLARTVADTSTPAGNTPAARLSWAYSYTPQGLLATETAPGGAVTTYGYDALGNLTSVKNPLGHSTRLSYDAAGRITQITDPNGMQVRYSYDKMGRLLTRTLAGRDHRSETDHFTWRPSGQLATATLASGLMLSYRYDDAQRLTGVSDNRGNRVAYTLDGMGNRTATIVQNADGSTALQQQAVISTLNRIAELTGADGSPKTTWGYDANGDVIRSTNGLNHATGYTLDGLRRLTAERFADGATARLSYDANDQLTQAQDPRGVATQYQVNGLGQVTHSSSADTGPLTTTYNAAGLPEQSTDASGNTTLMRYDALGRITQTIHTAAANSAAARNSTQPWVSRQVSTRVYDRSTGGIGVLTQVTDASTIRLAKAQETDTAAATTQQLHAITRYQYDSLGRIGSKQQSIHAGNTTLAAHTVRYQYAAGALLQNITTPLGNHIGYQFDKGRISGITLNGQPLLTNIRSNALGQITGWSIALAGAAQPRTINRRFDANARMTASSLHAYQYDAAGRITHITGLAQSAAADQHHTLQYDSRDRLTRFASTNGSGTTGNTVSTTTYRFDANGNRTATTQTTEAGSGASTTTIPSTTQADSNRLATLHQQVVPTDAAGNITAVDGVSLLHDPAGRISAVTSNRQATHYLHNAWGQRIYKGSTRADHLPMQAGTAYVYDEAGYLLGEYAAGSSTEYVWLPSDAGVFAVAVVHNGQVYAIEADHLDTPRRISNAGNQTVWLWGYSGFGETGPQVTPDAPNGFVFNLRYPGQYFDDRIGLFLFRIT